MLFGPEHQNLCLFEVLNFGGPKNPMFFEWTNLFFNRRKKKTNTKCSLLLGPLIFFVLRDLSPGGTEASEDQKNLCFSMCLGPFEKNVPRPARGTKKCPAEQKNVPRNKKNAPRIKKNVPRHHWKNVLAPPPIEN